MNNLKPRLKHILERHEGRLQAITSRELSQITGEPDRKVRLVIRELISEGIIPMPTEQPIGVSFPDKVTGQTQPAAGAVMPQKLSAPTGPKAPSM